MTSRNTYFNSFLKHFLEKIVLELLNQGGHKPGKHGKLRESEKLSKSRGRLKEILIFMEKTWKTQGKCGICGIIADENVLQRIILSGIPQGKV